MTLVPSTSGGRAAGYPGQPHRRRAGAEAGQQQVQVSALCRGPVKLPARGYEGHPCPDVSARIAAVTSPGAITYAERIGTAGSICQ
jgi:hypothetical protein